MLPLNAKSWSESIADTMTMFAGFGNRISLDKLCRVLGIDSPKDGIDGSKVYDYLRDGKIEEVAAYCKRDIKATREAYHRLSFT
jgi:predicted PolB exonuclease-like 3'-5' exonuclease